MSPSPPLIIAHRGLSGDEPENSLAAFSASAERGVEAIELDVHCTLDRVIVVSHDPKVAGLCIEKTDFAALSARSPELCTLRHVLELLEPGCLLDIEPKRAGFEKELLTELLEYRDSDEFILTSFDDAVLARFKSLNPALSVGLLIGKGKPHHPIRTRISELFPVSRLRNCHADFVAPHWKLLRFGFLSRMSRAGFGVYVWTVNSDEMLMNLIEKPGVTAIITDRPLDARSIRDGSA